MSEPSAPPRPVRRPPRPRPEPESVYRRRRLVVGAAAAALVIVAALGLTKVLGGDDAGSLRATDGTTAGAAGKEQPDGSTASTTTSTTAPVVPEVAAPELTPDRAQGEAGSSGETGLAKVQSLGGESMAPKSIVASGNGVLFAQNMMYRHSISVFDAAGALVKTIPDTVDLAAYGIDGHPGETQGAPVEMAFSPDGATAWVSNYSMYGAGFGPEGSDTCSPGDGTDDSYLYKVDVATHEITAVIGVGAVPKYVAATPDGSKVLVTNWCTWDLSVIDTATDTEVQRIPLGGRYPRGIAVSEDSRTAYIVLMGSDRMVTVDLGSAVVANFSSPGDGPRHVVISPDGQHLYVSNNSAGTVAKVDRTTGQVVSATATGDQPRSLTISADGEAIYVVNYKSSTMTKVRTSDMSVMQTVQTDAMPIGITYEPTEQRVWVACYGGTILVFDDSRKLTD